MRLLPTQPPTQTNAQTNAQIDHNKHAQVLASAMLAVEASVDAQAAHHKRVEDAAAAAAKSTQQARRPRPRR